MRINNQGRPEYLYNREYTKGMSSKDRIRLQMQADKLKWEINCEMSDCDYYSICGMKTLNPKPEFEIAAAKSCPKLYKTTL